MPARRRSRGHDCRHNTSSLVYSSGGTYTRSVSLPPSLLSFSLHLCLSPSCSLSLSFSFSTSSARTCVSSWCSHICVTIMCISCVYVNTHSWPCVSSCVRMRALSPLFFSAFSLSRCVEGNSRSLLLLSFASVGRPRKHTPRQGDLLGETSSSTQPWTRFLYASLLRSPSVRLAISLYFSRSF